MPTKMIHINANILKTKRLNHVDQNDSSPPNHISVPPQHIPTSLTSGHPSFLDSGASGTYVMIRFPVTYIRPTMQTINVRLPCGASTKFIHEVILPLPSLPAAVRRAHIFPSLMLGYLISVGALTDSSYTVILLSMTVHVNHQGCVYLIGIRDPSCGLWCISIPATAPALPPAAAPSKRCLVVLIANIANAPAASHNTSTSH